MYRNKSRQSALGTGRTLLAGVVSIFAIVLAGCGAADTEEGRGPGKVDGKADSTWNQLSCEEMSCEYGCELVLACDESSCFEVPACVGMEEALCKDVSCPVGTYCTAYKDYCWEEDCPKEVVKCTSGSNSGSCHCDSLCSLPQYNDCCADCADGGSGNNSGNGGYGSSDLQPCHGVCWYGARCIDYCPPSASCQQVIDTNQSYWQVLGCGG